jgi:uncharacterized protein (DUF305 family)
MKKLILIISAAAFFNISTAATDSHDQTHNMTQTPLYIQNSFILPMPVFDVMAPVDVLVSQKFKNYSDCEKFAHDLMMGDNSAYLTADTGNNFAVYMTLHHEAAIITSSGIKDITNDPRVARLAENIIKAQSTEVEEMQNLIRLNSFSDNENPSFIKSMDTIMNNMMKKMDMPSGDLTPDQATEVFLKNMIVHHEGAVEMAKAYLKTGKNPKLIKIAKNILATQPKEIKEMQSLLKK